MRAARLVGDATRRAVEGWVALFLEAILAARLRQGHSALAMIRATA